MRYAHATHDILLEPIGFGPKTSRNRFWQTSHCTGYGSERPGTQAHFRGMKAEGGARCARQSTCRISAQRDGREMTFKGKVVLVTGSTTGIGEACARVFAESDAAVMVCGRNESRGRKVVQAIRSAGGRAEFTAVDTTDEQWLDTMAVNVNALFYLSRAAIRHMKHKGGGAIVNIASEWGLNGEPNHVAYCASKGAVVQITRCMALDHARDRIRVNSVCPGEIHTQMVDDILANKGGDLQQNLQELAAGIPMRRLASPTEVAWCVHFLASDRASYVTGANLPVDGGNDATGGPYP